MALLTYSSAPSKGSTVTVTLDKALLLGLNAVGVDSFWSGGDDGDIATAIVTLKTNPGNGKINLKFNLSDNPCTAQLTLPLYCRDVFQVNKIAVIDTLGDKITIIRSTLLSEIPTLPDCELDLAADTTSPTITSFQASKTQVTDGTWTSQSLIQATQWSAIAWSPTLNLFAAVGAFGTSGKHVATSPDGVTWTIRTVTGLVWQGVTWAAGLGLFVAVAGNGVQRVMTSPDGITWTNRTHSSTSACEDITWSQELGLLVSIGSGSNPRVMTSPDGINWTSRTATNASWVAVTWSSQLGIFAAVGFSGVVMTSPDGINWTDRTSGYAYNLNDVTWSPELGIFAAIATNGSSTPIVTSPDGINWTTRSAPVSFSGSAITWASGLGMFIAIAGSGSNRVLTSTNGISWTTGSAAAANNWRDIVWSPELGRAVAISSDGSNRAMTLSSSTNLNFTVSAQDNVSDNLTLRYYSLPSSYSSVQDIESNGALIDTKTTSSPAVGYASSVNNFSGSATIFGLVAEDDSNNKNFATDTA